MNLSCRGEVRSGGVGERGGGEACIAEGDVEVLHEEALGALCAWVNISIQVLCRFRTVKGLTADSFWGVPCAQKISESLN